MFHPLPPPASKGQILILSVYLAMAQSLCYISPSFCDSCQLSMSPVTVCGTLKWEMGKRHKNPHGQRSVISLKANRPLRDDYLVKFLGASLGNRV